MHIEFKIEGKNLRWVVHTDAVVLTAWGITVTGFTIFGFAVITVVGVDIEVCVVKVGEPLPGLKKEREKKKTWKIH